MRIGSLIAALLLPFAAVPCVAGAAVTSQQATALHGTLTPVGAERAGNSSGSIPPWTGGLSAPPEAGKTLGIPNDPFTDERPVITIDRWNAAHYADRLPEGAMVLLRRFSDFRIRVFPTHRTAAMPQSVYDAIAANAIRAHAAPSGIAYGIEGAAGGIPFPIPTNGAEIVWNHLLAFWGAAREDHVNTYVAAGDGRIEQTAGYREISDFPYYAPGATPGARR